jgi:transcriptional regulator with XRE-family HTH domain
VYDVCGDMTTVTPPTTFADYLRDCRTAAGLLQRELAVRSGISVNSIMKYEAGSRRPTAESAERLATALNLEGEAREQMLDYALPEPEAQTITRVMGSVDALLQRLEEVEARLARLERRDGQPRRRA